MTSNITTEPRGREIVLDTETTGLSPRTGHKIVEIAAVEVIDGQLTGNHFHSYVNPQRHVPKEASDVHGLTNDFLRDKPTFAQIAPAFFEFVRDPRTPAWAHNAPFDARFVNAELEAADLPALTNFTCSLKLARKVLGKGDRKLATLAAMAGIPFGGRGAHSAVADTEVLAQVLITLLWGKEEIAPTPARAPAKARPAKTKPAPRAIILPAGFTPLTADADPRICRYDDEEIDHLLTSRGKRWTHDEETGLIQGFLKKKRQVMDLVAEHGRSPAALFLKLETLGVIAQGHPYARTENRARRNPPVRHAEKSPEMPISGDI